MKFLIKSSHVLKEQSNVALHHPEYCDRSLIRSHDFLTPAEFELRNSSVSPALAVAQLPDSNDSQRNVSHLFDTSSNGNDQSEIQDVFYTRSNGTLRGTNGHQYSKLANDSRIPNNSSNPIESDGTVLPGAARRNLCIDREPKFVNQSSICWYVLSVGLSFYLLDLILRRLRRSKSKIDLIEAKTNGEGNLVELVLDNNHRRFKNWVPGQYVYLNCPQIAPYEWHPFTISSMNDAKRQFTLHIKTGGDWTRRLKSELELRQMNRNAHFLANLVTVKSGKHEIGTSSTTTPLDEICPSDKELMEVAHLDVRQSNQSLYLLGGQAHSGDKSICALSGMAKQKGWNHCQPIYSHYYDHSMAELGVQCKRVSPILDCPLALSQSLQEGQAYLENRRSTPIVSSHNHFGMNISRNLQYLHDSFQANNITCTNDKLCTLELFVDGPFHSPFERLLEQQVSICIANGVGWTAFSSIFQLSAQKLERDGDKTWWSKWSKFSPAITKGSRRESRYPCETPENISSPPVSVVCERDSNPSLKSSILSTSSPVGNGSSTRLHLMVIVTTIEQLRPFYKIALEYFSRLNLNSCPSLEDSSFRVSIGDRENDVRESGAIREVSVFLTRGKC